MQMGRDDSSDFAGFENGKTQHGSQSPKHSQKSASKRHAKIMSKMSASKATVMNTTKKGVKKTHSTQLMPDLLKMFANKQLIAKSPRNRSFQGRVDEADGIGVPCIVLLSKYIGGRLEPTVWKSLPVWNVTVWHHAAVTATVAFTLRLIWSGK
jgi:hypothetical protein